MFTITPISCERLSSTHLLYMITHLKVTFGAIINKR